jgi:transmembrane 9 superfamily protein 3
VTLRQTGNPVLLDHKQPTLEIEFTYSVEWLPSTIDFENRFERLLESDFFEHQVHWLSIFSSFLMVLFLTGLVAVILLRTIKNDYARYDREESLADFVSVWFGFALAHHCVFCA